MTTDIRIATLRDVTYVASNMTDADRKEVTAVYPAPDTEIGAALYIGSNRSWCAWSHGSPQVAWGFSPIFPGVVSGWAIMTDRGVKLMRAVTVHMLKVIRPAMLASEVRRIEVRASIDHHLSHRWLQWLGMRFEGICPDYGSDGLAFMQFAITRASVAEDERRKTYGKYSADKEKQRVLLGENTQATRPASCPEPVG